MRDALRKRRTLAFELERAVSDEELTVVYQPVVRLEDCRAVALEALVRWNHPERGLVPPVDFIAFAEELGRSSRSAPSCSSAWWRRRRSCACRST